MKNYSMLHLKIKRNIPFFFMVYLGLFEIWPLELPQVSTDVFIHLFLEPHEGHYSFFFFFFGTYQYVFLSHNPMFFPL